MNIVIIGAGTIGINLAKELAEEDHEVYLIESNAEIARKADEKIDVKVICGNGADPATLQTAVNPQTELVIAVTTSDESNLVVCSLAAAFGAKRRIARVRNTALSNVLSEFGYKHFNINETINPEQVAAQDIVHTILSPGSSEVVDFAEGRILLRAFEIKATSHLCNIKLGDLNVKDFPWPFLIVSIVRDDKVMIASGDSVVSEGDRVYVLMPAQSLGEILAFVDPEIKMPKKIIVYGATITGEHVAQALSETIKDVILIEEDPDIAQAAAGRLTTTKVINGSASEADILTECGVEAADALIAASNNDQANLVSAVLAKKMGARATVITTNQPDYMTIVDALNIDVIVNPRFLAVDQILRIVRGKGVSAVARLFEGDAETLELIPEEGAAITKAPLKDISFPKNSIVGAVYSGKDVALANGDTHIKAGQKVIVFCHEKSAKKMQDMFTRNKTLDLLRGSTKIF